jgi:hypothetical protein
MESAQRRRRHYDDAGLRRAFRRDGEAGSGDGRRERQVCGRQVVRRDDFRDRQPTIRPAERDAFTRRAISDFEEPPSIPSCDFKYRAVIAAARLLNDRVGHIEAARRPGYICRF